jgi:hypothetical protein
VSSLTRIATILCTVLVDCSTMVYQQGDRAAGSTQAAAVQLQQQKQSVEVMMARLNELVNKPAADLKPQFESFRLALGKLAVASQRGPGTGMQMVRSTAAYISAWNRELTVITNTRIRSLSTARKAEVTDQLNAVSRHYADAQKLLRALVYHVEDFHKALGADLTQGGTQAVTALMSELAAEASWVQAALGEVHAELGALSTAMSTAGGARRT